MAASESPLPLATRLRDALAQEGYSQRGFAKAIAAETGAKEEHERRALLRHLGAENTPDEERARLYARLLGKPADYFIDEQPSRRQVDVLLELRGMVAALTEMIETEAVADRLGSLEAKMTALMEGLDALKQTVELDRSTKPTRRSRTQPVPEERGTRRGRKTG